MTLRPISAVLLIAGLTAGTVADDFAPRTPVKTERGTVLRADFHVHAFPGDGLLPAWELADEANRRGIDVVAITNHNQTLAASFAARRSGRLPLVLPGQEVTSPSFHLVAVGVREVVDWRLPLGGVIDAIHAQGGVAIAAHPVRHSWHANPESAAALDGSEAMHSLSATDPAGGIELLEFHRAIRLRKPTLAAIGSSDFHAVAPMGRATTYLLVDEIFREGSAERHSAGTHSRDRPDRSAGWPSRSRRSHPQLRCVELTARAPALLVEPCRDARPRRAGAARLREMKKGRPRFNPAGRLTIRLRAFALRTG